MSSSEAHSKDAQETNKDDAVLPQIGEDPGLTAEDTVEQDSKSVDRKQNRQGKLTDVARTTEQL